MRQLYLFSESPIKSQEGPRAIEDGFPIGFISRLAEHESWRKDIYRPPYYIHKWWARRLGSVFRSILISACIGESQDTAELFYKSVKFPEITVFDPFMGSGTTIGEAIKLGCRAIGRDINPVSYFLVSTAVQNYERKAVVNAYDKLKSNVGAQILSFYKTSFPSGKEADILYYFWVKTANCPNCGESVDLFKSRIFSQNATPQKDPSARAVCPNCSKINDILYDQEKTSCSHCGFSYNPQKGALQDDKVTCPSCQQRFKIIDIVKATGEPLAHRMYAKLVLTHEDKKVYLPIDQSDQLSYTKAEELLERIWEKIPVVKILPGNNTKQVLNYNYHFWHQMFNARQLACLALLANEIGKIPDAKMKQLFACLFSGTLEFNNMFSSFKGEGTGAVRHMFAHHILKPEMTPLEANLWGTHKSSGSFSTLFKSRILRALDYKDRPFELSLMNGVHGKSSSKEVHDLSLPMNKEIASTYDEFKDRDAVYLSCGDSSRTDILSESVDLVITDPPFFDNVHYSELADFFYVWLRKINGAEGIFTAENTRSEEEVQNVDSVRFTSKLASVFSECSRLLKKNGLLIFTYHHSRPDGWASVYQAIHEAEFTIAKVHPVKAEMSVSVPIQQAKVPINFDLIFVCRKKYGHAIREIGMTSLIQRSKEDTLLSLNKLLEDQVVVGIGDIKLILMGHYLARLSSVGNLGTEIDLIYQGEPMLDELAGTIYSQSFATNK